MPAAAMRRRPPEPGLRAGSIQYNNKETPMLTPRLSRRGHAALRADLAPLCAVLALAGSGAQAAETAQQYPSRPIRLIVPSSPGGVTDTGARLVADKPGQRLGPQVIVDNKPGGSGNIGTRMAAQAEP